MRKNHKIIVQIVLIMGFWLFQSNLFAQTTVANYGDDFVSTNNTDPESNWKFN